MSVSADGYMTLLSGATSKSAPSSMTDSSLGDKLPFTADQVTLLVRSTAGSDTMTASLRLWGFCIALNRWYSLGLLNSGTAIAEADTDLLSYVETVVGLRRFSHLYMEIESLGGTGTAIEVVAWPVRSSGVG